MNSSGQDRLYSLIPALFRQVDEPQGQPLRALLNVLESEFLRLEENIGAAYDDWFIETCDLWVVPYIADLLGVRELKDVEHIPSQRRLVANSIAYRRRKGTLGVLEKVARDATGWPAQAVEYSQLVASTKDITWIEQESGRTVNVSALGAESSIDELPHTLEFDDSEQAKYSPVSIGLSLYRLRSYPIRRSFAQPVPGHPGCFTFDPLGLDMPLFNQPQPVMQASQHARPANLPAPLRRADLEEDLREYRGLYGALNKNSQPAESSYYGPDRSFYIELRQRRPVIKPANITSMDLSQWPATGSLAQAIKDKKDIVVAVDVERGRMAFITLDSLQKIPDSHDSPQPITLLGLPSHIIVNYSYGFSSELGGGPYQREIRLPSLETSVIELYVAKGARRLPETQASNGVNRPGCVPSLSEALELWEKLVTDKQRDPHKTSGVITILDNGVYDEKLTIKLPIGTQLFILAAPGVCPSIGSCESGQAILVSTAEPGSSQGQPPDAIPGSAEEKNAHECRLTLNGLHLLGGLQIEPAAAQTEPAPLSLTIAHCSLIQREKGQLKPAPLRSQQAANHLALSITSSILGPVYLPSATIKMSACIVDNAAGYAIAGDSAGSGSGPAVTLKNVTIFGRVDAEKVSANGVIFTGPLQAPPPTTPDQIEHCYIPQWLTTQEAGKPSLPIAADLTPPQFTSTQYGHPGYGQLDQDCHASIRRTADGSEMGAFHDLYQVLAEENLQAVLNEYLPRGMHAHIHYAT